MTLENVFFPDHFLTCAALVMGFPDWLYKAPIAYPVLPVQSYVHCKRHRQAHDDAIESTQRQSDHDLQAVKARTVVNALVTPNATANALEANFVRVRFSSQLSVVFELDKSSVEGF